MQGIDRGTPYGYSLYEFEVYEEDLENMVENGDFINKATAWEIYTENGAEARLSISDYSAHISVNKVGLNPWSVILYQRALDMEYGATYTVTFDAKTDEPRYIPASVAMNSWPWTVYSDYDYIYFSDTMQTHSFTFTMDYEMDFDAVLQFEFGDGPDVENIDIDNIKMVKEEGPDPDTWTRWTYYGWGDIVIYNGYRYKCTYYHLAQYGWEPNRPQMWAVWTRLGPA
jgi:hypothetical protein